MLGWVIFSGITGIVIGALGGYALAAHFCSGLLQDQYDHGYVQGRADASRLTFGLRRKEEFE